ncbi:beta-galactosidase, partial [candidate division KSB1 bacterium]|nr:beta-galactosidase [candidate division KSB1 bacterium]
MEFRTAFFFLCFVFVSCVHARHPLIGAQVFIEPGQSRENIEGWFRLLDQHHMNVCRIRMFEDHVKPGTDAWDFSLYDFAFDMAEKYNVKILATLFPSDPGSVGGFKFPKDQQHLESVGRFIDTVVQHYKSHPALDTWVLQNEPGVGDYQKTPLSLAKFEQWQQDRSSGKNSSGYLKVPLDWELFWRDYTTWYLRWIAERIRKYDTVSQTHVNNHQLFINLPQYDFPAWM